MIGNSKDKNISAKFRKNRNQQYCFKEDRFYKGDYRMNIIGSGLNENPY